MQSVVLIWWWHTQKQWKMCTQLYLVFPGGKTKHCFLGQVHEGKAKKCTGQLESYKMKQSSTQKNNGIHLKKILFQYLNFIWNYFITILLNAKLKMGYLCQSKNIY